MNKIKVVNDNLICANVAKNIRVEYYKKEDLFAINDIKITILKSTSLDIDINLKEEGKINFIINILDNVNLKLNIISRGNTGKVQYKYDIGKNSNINVFKFQDVDSIKEMICINLNNNNSSINYNFKTVANLKETYDYYIYHNADNTISNIKNNGVCVYNGEIIYQVSSFVPKDITGCIVDQNNRIINLTNNKCEIRPNLYIDNLDTEASHSALIGKFSEEEMFYIQSRGINKIDTTKLLIGGFLRSNITSRQLLSYINKNINKYWR